MRVGFSRFSCLNLFRRWPIIVLLCLSTQFVLAQVYILPEDVEIRVPVANEVEGQKQRVDMRSASLVDRALLAGYQMHIMRSKPPEVQSQRNEKLASSLGLSLAQIELASRLFSEKKWTLSLLNQLKSELGFKLSDYSRFGINEMVSVYQRQFVENKAVVDKSEKVSSNDQLLFLNSAFFKFKNEALTLTRNMQNLKRVTELSVEMLNWPMGDMSKKFIVKYWVDFVSAQLFSGRDSVASTLEVFKTAFEYIRPELQAEMALTGLKVVFMTPALFKFEPGEDPLIQLVEFFAQKATLGRDTMQASIKLFSDYSRYSLVGLTSVVNSGLVRGELNSDSIENIKSVILHKIENLNFISRQNSPQEIADQMTDYYKLYFQLANSKEEESQLASLKIVELLNAPLRDLNLLIARNRVLVRLVGLLQPQDVLLVTKTLLASDVTYFNTIAESFKTDLIGLIRTYLLVGELNGAEVLAALHIGYESQLQNDNIKQALFLTSALSNLYKADGGLQEFEVQVLLKKLAAISEDLIFNSLLAFADDEIKNSKILLDNLMKVLDRESYLQMLRGIQKKVNDLVLQSERKKERLESSFVYLQIQRTLQAVSSDSKLKSGDRILPETCSALLLVSARASTL